MRTRIGVSQSVLVLFFPPMDDQRVRSYAKCRHSYELPYPMWAARANAA